MIEIPGKYTTAKVMIDEIEPESMKQIHSFINNESFTNQIAIMPDVHAGKGSVIGFTMPMNERIIPNVVGVDENCGMLSVRFDLRSLKGLQLDTLDDRVRATIPMGQTVRKHAVHDLREGAFWTIVNEDVIRFVHKFNEKYGTKFETPWLDYSWFLALCRRVGIDFTYAVNSIGTLGGGNHFIEIGIDEEGYIWITIHSGSRNLGYKACDYWQNIAIERRHERLGLRKDKATEIERIKQTYPKREWNRHIKKLNVDLKRMLASDGLEYLEGEDMFGYLIDSIFTYHYARLSRRIMATVVSELIGAPEPIDSISTVHNYVDYKDFIIRKGAIGSYENEKMVIPFNMEDGLLICEGKSNAEWNFSAPHGAGRLFSRGDAKRKLDGKAAEASMKEKGIYSSVVPVDECRSAYKPAAVIEAAIEPTATIIHKVRPLMNFKADEEKKRR